MLRLLLVLAVAAASLALAAPSRAETTHLFPGVTYERKIEFTPHGPVAMHIVRGPRPVGLHRLRPVLSNEAVVGRETVSSMQRRLSAQATTVGVNGDFYASKRGAPTGILLRDGVLINAPHSNRSSAGIGLDGTLDIRRVRFFGTWRGSGQRRPINTLNEIPESNRIALYTSDWGRTTPRIQGAFSVVLSPFPAATPNADLTATVAATYQSGSVSIAPGTAVLVARGTAAQRLAAEALVGTTVTVRLILQPDWATVADAIGGGPVLVRDGAPVFRANEAFSAEQLAPRHPRTAVGQLPGGRIVMVAVDGRQPGYSIGMTTFELALTMDRLGATRAMALDGGGSTTIAFNGTVFNRPSDGRERPIPTALMLFYSGVYLPPPTVEVHSPNGDGFAEEQSLSYKIVRPSTVAVTLTAPDGTPIQETGSRAPGTYRVPFPPAPASEEPAPIDPEPLPPAEGRWTLGVRATDDQGLVSSATRRFWVNSTLGFLNVQPKTLRLPPVGRSATVSWTQTRAATVAVTVETASGVVVRRLPKRRLEPGKPSVVWDGRNGHGRLVFGGVYRIRVTAWSSVGPAALEGELRVRRIAGPKPKRPVRPKNPRP